MAQPSEYTLLIAGGYGMIGSALARRVQHRSPQTRLVIAGRDPDRAAELARQLRNAVPLQMDLDAPLALSLGAVDAVVAATPDRGLHLAEWAIAQGAAYIDITPAADDLAPLAALAAARSPRRPVVPLGYYEAGALVPLVRRLARKFDRVDAVYMAAVYDPADPVGATTATELGLVPPPALIRRDGAWTRTSAPRTLALATGSLEATPLGTFEAATVAALTGALDVRFDVAIGPSIGTHRRAEPSMDLHVEMSGWTNGEARRHRLVASNPHGQAHFTSLNIDIVLEAVTATGISGLCFPDALVEPDAAIFRMEAAGVHLEEAAI